MTQKTNTKTSSDRIPVSGILFAGPVAALCLSAVALPALAQDAGAPPLLFIDISTGLEYEDQLNRDGAFEATTSLGVGYFSSTADQRLSFETGVTARGTEDQFDLINPFATIAYARFNRDTEIGFDLSYLRSEIEGDDLDDDFDAGDLERQDGVREDIDVGVRLITGRASPFGTDTRLRYAQENFFDGATDDDTVTYNARSTLRFTIDPRIELRLTGSWDREETDDAIQTVDTTRRLTLGADLAIDRAWSASVGIGYAELETETTGGTTLEDGVEASLLIARDLPNGGLAFSSDHVLEEDGWRNSVRLRRTIETANGDIFNASIGQIFFEEGGSGHLASLDYTRTVRSGSFSVALNYESDLDAADQLIQRTRLDATLRQNLTEVSGWSLDGGLASVEYDNPVSIDALRVDVGLSYLHALSNDWTLAARVEHQVLYEDGDIDDRTNTLSLNLERRFSVRP